MAPGDLPEAFRSFLASWEGEGAAVDTPAVVPGTTAFLVPSFDNGALRFSFPIRVARDFLSETGLPPAGADGAAGVLIERIKAHAEHHSGFGPLYGRGVPFSDRYRDTLEPYTVIHSDDAIGSGLWKADDRNFCDGRGVHLVLTGVLPSPAAASPAEARRLVSALAELADAVSGLVQKAPLQPVTAAWLASLDQKQIRDRLPGQGLVAFASDGSRPARSFTRHRPFFRVAGPKQGVNIPFACPQELEPVELELPATGGIVTGLGIRRREVLAVAGSNAQGKTTFLEAIRAGVDDHAPHDGRERIITVQGVCIAESTNMGLAGTDISMFFSALPPGVSGTVKAAFGAGSGSMTMAGQVQAAIARKAPLLVIDEDRAAPNLLVRSCLQKVEITPLSAILGHQKEKMGETALLFAACAMDELIAQADRILLMDRHEASAIDPPSFRRLLASQLRRTADSLESLEKRR